MGIQQRMAKRFVAILNCRINNISFTYLGIKVGANNKW